jgi:hypothetical protein
MINIWTDTEAFKGSAGEMNFDPGFKQDSMLEQFSRVIDSSKIIPGVDLPEHKYRPITTVVTDDGDEFVVTATQAETMYDIAVSVKASRRLDFLKTIQTTTGFTILLSKIDDV